MPIYKASSQEWIFHGIVIKFENCLQSTDKIRIYRGFKQSTFNDIILKIILMNNNLLKDYQKIVKNAELFYNIEKKTQSFINLTSQVVAYISNQKISLANKDKQSYLYLIRPYFAGNNIHEAVYVNMQFSFQKEQFHIFIKYSIALFSKINYVQCLEPTFIPTLDNVYFDNVKLNANLLSIQTLMFLKGKMAHLSVENFKHLFVLLKSDPEIFVNWEQMKSYMGDEMLCRGILILWITMMTVRSPIEMIWNTKVNDQDLQWNHLLLNYGGSENYDNGKKQKKQQKKINNNNKVIWLIKDVPKLWQQFLDKPQNIACFQLYSQSMFEIIEQGFQLSEQGQKKLYIKDKQQQKKYFYNLFCKVFVKQEKFGQKELFRLSEIFMYLQQMDINTYEKKLKKQEQKQEKQQVKKKEIKIQKQNAKKQVIIQISNRKKMKINAMLQSFIYVHKYFLYKDIKRMELSKEKAEIYAKRLRFETYVPFKIGLPIEKILHYENWFEVFFIEKQNHMPQVYQAANYLFDMLDEESGTMLESVIFAHFYHIKRVLYLLGMKLAQNKQPKETYVQLQKQVEKFISKHRSHEYVLKSLESDMKRISKSQTQKPHVNELTDSYLKFFNQDKNDNCLEFVIPFLAYLSLQGEKSQSHSQNVSDEYRKNMKRIFQQKANKAFQLDYRKKNQDSTHIPYKQSLIEHLNKQLQLNIANYKK